MPSRKRRAVPNSGGNQSKRGFDRAYGGESTPLSRRMWTYNDVDLARVASDMGALGIRVDKPADLRPSVERWRPAARRSSTSAPTST